MSVLPDILIEGTVLGTPYRKLLLYDLASIESLRTLKTRVLNDLRAAGALLENENEVVLRNYRLTDYDCTPFYDTAESCALFDHQAGDCRHGRHGRLLAASPSPRLPVNPEDEDRHAILAIASRQLFDRSQGSGAVLPLEARVKPRITNFEAIGAGDGSPEGQAPIAAAGALTSGRLATAESPAFDITVRDFRGRSHCVRVSGSTSVQRVKQGVATALGCSVVSHWRLCHEGRSLAENLDLGDYSIGPGSVIEIQLTSQQSAAQRQPSYRRSSAGQVAVGTPMKDSAAAAAAAAGRKAAAGGGNGGGAGAGGATAAGGVLAGFHGGPHAGAAAAGTQTGANGADRAAGASQIAVQVLLPCGRVIHVPRRLTDDPADFLGRVLEAEAELLRTDQEQPPTKGCQPASGPEAAEPEEGCQPAPKDRQPASGPAAAEVEEVRAGATTPSASEPAPAPDACRGAAGAAPACANREAGSAAARAARAAMAPQVAAFPAAAQGARPLSCGGVARWSGRRGSLHLPGLVGQKLVALLFAVAAVAMALAVL